MMFADRLTPPLSTRVLAGAALSLFFPYSTTAVVVVSADGVYNPRCLQHTAARIFCDVSMKAEY